MSSNRSSNNGTQHSQTSTGGRENENAPEIVEGWEYHTYARSSDRYVYIGKDMSSDGKTPAFLDYGKKQR